MKKPLYLRPLITAMMLVLCLGGCSSPTPSPPAEDSLSPADYFPTAAGSRWEYEGQGNEYAAYVRELPFVQDHLAQFYVDNGGTVLAEIVEITDQAATRVFSEEEHYTRENLLEKGYTPNRETVLLKAPLTAGASWETEDSTREITADRETVTTPAGTFSDCLKIKIVYQDSEAVIYEYYAPEIGLVKSEFSSQESEISSRLEKYTLGS